MQRRNFFKSLGIGAGVLCVPVISAGMKIFKKKQIKLPVRLDVFKQPTDIEHVPWEEIPVYHKSFSSIREAFDYYDYNYAYKKCYMRITIVEENYCRIESL